MIEIDESVSVALVFPDIFFWYHFSDVVDHGIGLVSYCLKAFVEFSYEEYEFNVETHDDGTKGEFVFLKREIEGICDGYPPFIH